MNMYHALHSNFRLSNMNHTNVKNLLMCREGGKDQIDYKKLNISMIICDRHFLSLSHDGDRETLVSCHFLKCNAWYMLEKLTL
jgi:hypothetical protein